MGSIDKNYYSILEALKEKIRRARQKAAIAVNNELLSVYWEIGNAILQQQKEEGWGTKVIDRLVADLKTEFPDMKGLSVRNLKYMRAFAEAYPQFVQQAAAQIQSIDNKSTIIVQQLAAQLPWGHHQLLLDKIKKTKERDFYIKKAVENGWSRNVLLHQIESSLHLRQGNAITNFEYTLPKPQSDLARETLKNPYVFDFLGVSDEMQERELEKVLIQHIKKFLLELGRGFAYVGNQYNLNVESDEYFLDLLFYNYHLRRFVVFELKVGDFKPEFTGKLNFYINTIDEQIKGKDDNPTIGVLLCKTPNDTVVKYALKGIDTPMGVAEYEFTKALPKQLKGEMPTIEELQQELEKETEEFKENLSAVDARLKSIKEKLKGIKTDEIQTPATYPILINLYNEGLKSLYQEIIKKFSVFEEDFHSKSFGWRAGTTQTDNLEHLEPLWNNEGNLRTIKEVEFFYNFFGFKKAGTENYGEHLTLKFEMQDYWYGFTLVNHNDQQPFLKKLYHQSLNETDKQQIIDLLMSKVMDKIEWIIERMNYSASEGKNKK